MVLQAPSRLKLVQHEAYVHDFFVAPLRCHCFELFNHGRGCLIYFGAKHSFQNDCMPRMEV